jgi:hypothetical protein
MEMPGERHRTNHRRNRRNNNLRLSNLRGLHLLAHTKTKTNHKKHPCKTVVQPHHLRYKEKDGYDWIEPVFKGEHWLISMLNYRKNISEGCLITLQDYITRNQNKAAKLTIATTISNPNKLTRQKKLVQYTKKE